LSAVLQPFAADNPKASIAGSPTRLAGRFAHEGFLSIPSLTTLEDIATIRSLLDPLFEKFDTLGERAVDIAGPRAPGEALRSPEINEAVKLLPALRNTLVYQRCRRMARQLLGAPVGYTYDHAIYKLPHNGAATDWHQDEAYSARPLALRSAHFWIPLQDVTAESGCMWFVPGSNREGLREHYVAAVRTSGPDCEPTGATIATSNVDPTSAVACPLQVGGVTVHHPLTLHYTGPNQTSDWRRVWILHFGAYGRLRMRLHPKMIAARIRSASRISGAG
jgi:hypothetical protein